MDTISTCLDDMHILSSLLLFNVQYKTYKRTCDKNRFMPKILIALIYTKTSIKGKRSLLEMRKKGKSR